MTGPADYHQRVETLFERHPFVAHRWVRGGHSQTLVASQLRRDFSWGWKRARTRLLDLQDDSQVQCFTVTANRSKPTVVLIHGMAGSSDSGYMQGLSHKAYRVGWNAVLLNLYNRNLQRLRPKVFHAGCSSELKEIVTWLADKVPSPELFLVGVSMGGNIVLKLLGEWGRQPPPYVRSAAVLSPLVDLTQSWKLLDKPSNWLYRRYFLRRLRRLVRQHSHRLQAHLDLQKLARIRSIREYDELVTAPLAGFDNAMHYYRQVSACSSLGQIRVPTLIIHACDDPLLPWQPLVSPEAVENPSLLVQLSRRGGHVGFVEDKSRGDIDRCWAENRILDFFQVIANDK